MKRQYPMEPECDSDVTAELDLDECVDDLGAPPKKRSKLTGENENSLAVRFQLFDFCLICRNLQKFP